MMQGPELSVSGMLTFYSKEELKRYLKSLVEKYQVQEQGYGDRLGGLLRSIEQTKADLKAQAKENKDPKDKPRVDTKAFARGWVKMGTILVNVSDPNGAIAEVLFQLHEEVKVKLAKATEALKGYEELNSATIPEAGLFFLQMRSGIPERIVVDLQKSKKDSFSFSADFRLV